VNPARFHPEAAREFEEAASFYESRVAGLGESFHREVRRTVSLIQEYPSAGASVRPGIRRVIVDRFPFSIVYQVRAARIEIIAVAHHRRRPGYWRGRSA
jgi:plasmid stabilization system protein ParE